MVVITEELIDQLVKEYAEQHGYLPDEFCIQDIKNDFIGLHIDEKEASKFLEACDKFYWDVYGEGYDDG